MMAANARRLKQLVEDAAHQAGVNYRRYRNNFDVDELLEAIQDMDDPPTIAATGIYRLCIGEAGFNNNTVGLKAVLQFLAETSRQQPESNADVKACLKDLRDTIGVAGVGDDRIRRWIDQWYQF